MNDTADRPPLLRYACATCGNTCLPAKRPDNTRCGGCDKPDWRLLKRQEAYQVDGEDWIHPEGEV